jgi:hypothetical protein
LGEVGHPDAHGGVDGKIFYAGEGLAFGDGGESRFGELEDVGSNEAGGAIGEDPLAIGSWHGERVEEEEREVKRRGEKMKGFNAEFAEDTERAEKREDVSVSCELVDWMPWSLHCAARRAAKRRGGKDRAAPVGMTAVKKVSGSFEEAD